MVDKTCGNCDLFNSDKIPDSGRDPIYVRIKPEYAEKINSIKAEIWDRHKINVTNTGVIYYALDMALENRQSAIRTPKLEVKSV
ncbi:MAG TPA: hypothetical protein O0Y17_01145 [Methanocorpusculum sp.]|nr:hypothetical protein [Methanocorpusculum sp.]